MKTACKTLLTIAFIIAEFSVFIKTSGQVDMALSTLLSIHIKSTLDGRDRLLWYEEIIPFYSMGNHCSVLWRKND